MMRHGARPCAAIESQAISVTLDEDTLLLHYADVTPCWLMPPLRHRGFHFHAMMLPFTPYADALLSLLLHYAAITPQRHAAAID